MLLNYYLNPIMPMCYLKMFTRLSLYDDSDVLYVFCVRKFNKCDYLHNKKKFAFEDKISYSPCFGASRSSYRNLTFTMVI